MTSSEILEAAKSRFVVLYHREEPALLGLLKQALGRFQDKAGVIQKVKVQEGDAFPLPAHLLDVALIHDARHVYVPFDVEDAEIKAEISTATVYPLTCHYFVDLRSFVGTTDSLPAGCADLVEDYLAALIEVPNTDRKRSAMLATDQNASDLPSPQELRDRLYTLEQAMEDRQAMVPPVAVY